MCLVPNFLSSKQYVEVPKMVCMDPQGSTAVCEMLRVRGLDLSMLPAIFHMYKISNSLSQNYI